MTQKYNAARIQEKKGQHQNKYLYIMGSWEEYCEDYFCSMNDKSGNTLWNHLIISSCFLTNTLYLPCWIIDSIYL